MMYCNARCKYLRMCSWISANGSFIHSDVRCRYFSAAITFRSSGLWHRVVEQLDTIVSEDPWIHRSEWSSLQPPVVCNLTASSLYSDPEDESNIFLRNIRFHVQDYTVSQPRICYLNFCVFYDISKTKYYVGSEVLTLLTVKRVWRRVVR
jgi:hypothetical protein